VPVEGYGAPYGPSGNAPGRRYLPLLKGTTVMVDGTRPQAPYERICAGKHRLATVTVISDGIDEACASGTCPVR
jgi:hypothetical protein